VLCAADKPKYRGCFYNPWSIAVKCKAILSLIILIVVRPGYSRNAKIEIVIDISNG